MVFDKGRKYCIKEVIFLYIIIEVVGTSNMTHACNEICERYRATRPSDGIRYGSGQKRCKSCSIFINWEGIHCPCCGNRLRTMPRSTTDREEVRFIKATSRIIKKSNSDYPTY